MKEGKKAEESVPQKPIKEIRRLDREHSPNQAKVAARFQEPARLADWLAWLVG